MIKTIYFSSEEFESNLSSLEFFSLTQDLKLAKLNKRNKFKLLVNEYKKYVLQKKAKLDKSTIDEIDKLLITKFNALIQECEEDIKLNKDISTLLGVTDGKLKKSMYNFSKSYKKMVIARDTLNYIPKINQIKVDSDYKTMISDLRGIIFEPVLELFSMNKDPGFIPEDATNIENHTYSVEQLYDMVVGFLRKENVDLDKINIQINYES